MGAILGLLLLAAVFVVRMLMDDTLKTAEDVEKEFGIMPLTVIPEGNIQELSDAVEKAAGKQKKKKNKKRKK